MPNTGKTPYVGKERQKLGENDVHCTEVMYVGKEHHTLGMNAVQRAKIEYTGKNGIH